MLHMRCGKTEKADISLSAMEHGVSLFLKEMAYELCDGYSVNAGYFTATPLIKGVFSSPQEPFDPEKHALLFQFNQGDTLRGDLSSVEIEIMGVADTMLSVLQVTDVKTGSVNDLLTPNRNLKINGYKVRVAGEHADNGVYYFVNRTSGESTKVDPTDIVTNNPSELIIVIPALVAGTYKLRVTTQHTTATPLKEPRTAVRLSMRKTQITSTKSGCASHQSRKKTVPSFCDPCVADN